MLSNFRRFASKTLLIKEQQMFMKEATAFVNEKSDILNYLINCEFMYKFKLPFNRDNGDRTFCTAYRAIHGKEFKPSCGSILLNDTLEMQEIETLAAINKFRNALFGIPFSGSMGGIGINPTVFSEKELNSIMQLYVQDLSDKDYIGAYTDVISVEAISSEQIRNSIIDSVILFNPNEKYKYASVLGKPIERKGIAGSEVNRDLGLVNAVNHIINNVELCKSYNIYPGMRNRKVFICVFYLLGI